MDQSFDAHVATHISCNKMKDSVSRYPQSVEQISIASPVAVQWKMVGRDHDLATDSDIASFLLKLYSMAEKQSDRSAASGNVSCITCKKSLSIALCPQCALSYTASSDNTTVEVKVEKLEYDGDGAITNHCLESTLLANQHNRADTIASKPVTTFKGRPSRRSKSKLPLDDDDYDALPEVTFPATAAKVIVSRRGRKSKNCTTQKDDDYIPPEIESSDNRSDFAHTIPLPPNPPLHPLGPKRGRPRKDAQKAETDNEKTALKSRKKKATPCTKAKTPTGTSKNRTLSSNNQCIIAHVSDKDDEDTEPCDQANSDDDDPDFQLDSADENSNSHLARAINTADEEESENDSEDGKLRTEKDARRKGKSKVSGGKSQRKVGAFPCEICGAVFKEAYLTKRHQYIHSDEHGKNWKYKCEQCKRPFRQKGLYDAHMRTHSGTKLFACAICNVDFVVSKLLKRHVLSQHNDLVATVACFKCAQCGATFCAYKKYSNHMYRHTLDKNHVCEICSKAFSEPSLLATHMRVHTDERPFTCTECGRSFRQLGSLTSHMQRHRGERNFSCHLCPVKYYSKHQLKMHLAAHSGEKPYLCQTCGAGYTNSKSLQVHMRSHTGERPYKCDVCGKDFARPASFRTHQRRHANVRPYTCHICGMSFVDNSNYRRHHRLKHSGMERKVRRRGAFPPVECFTEVSKMEQMEISSSALPPTAVHLNPATSYHSATNLDSFREFVKDQHIFEAIYADRERKGSQDKNRAGAGGRDKERSVFEDQALDGQSKAGPDLTDRAGVDVAGGSRLALDTDHLRQVDNLQELLGRHPLQFHHYQY